MKRIFALFLTVLMFLTMLTACGSDDEKKMIGTWTTTLDMTEYLNKTISAADPTMGETIKFSDFSLTMVFDFKEDKTYTVSIDKDAFTPVYEKVMEDFKAGLSSYLAAMLAADETMQGVSIDELLAAVDLDAMAEEALDMDAILESFESSDGAWFIKDGKLYMDSMTDYMAYEFKSDDKFVVSECVGESYEEDGFSFPVPMTFTKK